MSRKIISPIHALLQQAEGYAAMVPSASESADLRSLQVLGDYQATQALVLARYRSKLSAEEQRISNVALLVCERYVADWKQLLERLGLSSSQPYASSGQFVRDWMGQRHVL